MHRYAVAVIEAAMRCYIELASWVTPRFDRTLGLLGLIPIEFFADMYYEPEVQNPYVLQAPGFAWVLRPIGTSADFGDANGNRVSLTINDEQRDRKIRDDRATLYTSFRRYIEANPVYEPFASSFATHHGGIEVFDRMPATRIAIDWLWEDLKQLKFVNGSPPNRL